MLRELRQSYSCHSFVCLAVLLGAILLAACKASAPSSAESRLAAVVKKVAIGGKDWKNPSPDNEESIRQGADHFQHHCQICHGLDGQNTGVPFADKMSPPVADLASTWVQDYTDGQLKWIIENGIRFTGMPGWKGTLEDEEMWFMVRYLRHLPAKGSLGVPQVFKESEEEHEKIEHHTDGEPRRNEHHHHHTHTYWQATVFSRKAHERY